MSWRTAVGSTKGPAWADRCRRHASSLPERAAQPTAPAPPPAAAAIRGSPLSGAGPATPPCVSAAALVAVRGSGALIAFPLTGLVQGTPGHWGHCGQEAATVPRARVRRLRLEGPQHTRCRRSPGRPRRVNHRAGPQGASSAENASP